VRRNPNVDAQQNGRAGVQFYFMHFMPYVHLPEDHRKYDSMWVDFPNSFYDAEKGHRLYERYLKELVLADELGYDALVVNEHHSTVYGMMASCNLIAAALIPMTKRAKIIPMGSLLNFQYPNRVAEEYAILDVLAGGRFECAFPLGTGMEYYSNASQVNPVTARERFRESLEIVLKGWTEDGPTAYDGRFYNYKFLNVWPRPFQKPHPKVWIVGSGSPETVEFASEHGFAYAVVFVPKDAQDRAYHKYKARTVERGHEFRPDKLMFSIFAYVAETDEIAEREGKDHILWYFQNALRTAPDYRMPPGYLSLDALRGFVSGGPTYVKIDPRDLDWETVKNWRAITGSPETVANTLIEWAEGLEAGTFLCHLHVGDMPHWKTVKNLTLFAEEVMPRVRKALGSKTARMEVTR
jgi:alkanesulfonate monooxygenase SsuD/methylene tetrahydromethanopterin reductase-like flavin-dependent oxidoreductase (luciferase family)